MEYLSIIMMPPRNIYKIYNPRENNKIIQLQMLKYLMKLHLKTSTLNESNLLYPRIERIISLSLEFP
jgi:hypothetical protein